MAGQESVNFLDGEISAGEGDQAHHRKDQNPDFGRVFDEKMQSE